MERIKRLRLRTLEDDRFTDEFFYHFYKKYASLPHLTEEERYTESFYHAFSTLTPAIAADELIVGNRDTKLSPEEKKEWLEIYRPIALKYQVPGGQNSHMTIDYELLLHHGINGIITKIDHYMESCQPEKLSFYKSCRRCLEAIVVHAERYAEKALEMSLCTADPARKAELETIASICHKVPAQPAGTFYEAVQSVSFITYCISLDPYIMKAIVETYLTRGGFEVQINVVDNETLKKARLHPEEYRDLVVRIGGYSDYFVKLSSQMQEEVILRTAHQI